MKFTIIPDDSNFGVDGVWRKIDLSALVGTVHAVQFDTVKGKGEVERGASGNEVITSFAQFQGYYDAWVAAGIPAPVPPPTLPQAQTAKLASLTQAYSTAIQQPVAYTGHTFQADTASQQVLTASLSAGAVPAGFGWLDINNVKVAMTYADLQGLAGAMLAQGYTAFVRLQERKAAVRAATTVEAVDLVIW